MNFVPNLGVIAKWFRVSRSISQIGFEFPYCRKMIGVSKGDVKDVLILSYC